MDLVGRQTSGTVRAHRLHRACVSKRSVRSTRDRHRRASDLSEGVGSIRDELTKKEFLGVEGADDQTHQWLMSVLEKKARDKNSCGGHFFP